MSHTTSRVWHQKLQQATETASRATKLEFSRSYSEAFESYIRAGQLYLWLVRNLHDRRTDATAAGSSSDGTLLASSLSSMSLEVSDNEMRDRLKRSAMKVMERAEKIKRARQDVRPVERQTLSYEEQSFTLSKSAKIDNLVFPLWSDPAASEFEQPRLYDDPDSQPALSPTQVEHRARYRRLRQGSSGVTDGTSTAADVGGFGLPLRGRDIVQDVVTDCSFVAALEVAAEHDRRWGTNLATSALYPKDDSGRVRPSANGKYIARLLINGSARRVTIDDSLPCYPDGSLMCATSREGQQTWPALLEKAYLKVMGGYDFLGSNSSVDLHALTGWIPDHVFLRHAGFQREKTWSRIMEAWSKGECMITAGTGNFREPRSPALEGLIPSHDYAVLALVERASRRYAMLMNPWSRATGGRPGIALPVDEERRILGGRLADGDQEGTGGFLLSWDDLCSRFDAIYLNWDPNRFQHQLTVHSTWKGGNASVYPQSVGQNPQFRLSLGEDGAGSSPSSIETEVWLLLVRHIEGKRSQSSSEQDNYMALHVFEHEDRHRIYQPSSSKKLGAYVDGTHNLIRLKIGSGATKAAYTVVVSRHGPNSNVNYSLSAYSSIKLQLRELPHAYPYHEKVSGAWSGRSAGGNVTHATFMNNPQYSITVSPPSTAAASLPVAGGSTLSQHQQQQHGGTVSLLLLLEAGRELPIQAQLVWSSSGGRISHCVEGDIAATSGMYHHGIAVAERTSLQPGTYTLVLSTFEPGQSGPFMLTAECSSPIRIRAIPQEGAGMYARTLRDAWRRGRSACGGPSNPEYEDNPSYLIKVAKPSTFQIRIKAVPLSSPSSPSSSERHRPYINVALFQVASASGTERARRRGKEVATSGPYVDYVCGAAIEGARVLPGEYVLIASTFSKGTEAEFTIDVYSDRPIDMNPVQRQQ